MRLVRLTRKPRLPPKGLVQQRSELAALGPTPNLAARQKGGAAAPQVVLSETTQKLVAGYFRLAPLPGGEFREITREVTCFRVVEEHADQSRFSVI